MATLVKHDPAAELVEGYRKELGKALRAIGAAIAGCPDAPSLLEVSVPAGLDGALSEVGHFARLVRRAKENVAVGRHPEFAGSTRDLRIALDAIDCVVHTEPMNGDHVCGDCSELHGAESVVSWDHELGELVFDCPGAGRVTLQVEPSRAALSGWRRVR